MFCLKWHLSSETKIYRFAMFNRYRVAIKNANVCITRFLSHNHPHPLTGDISATHIFFRFNLEHQLCGLPTL